MERKITYYWSLVFENFRGEDEVLYFIDYETAKANFDKIVELYREHEDFELEDTTTCSWFDSNYNEFYTVVSLIEQPPKVYRSVIF